MSDERKDGVPFPVTPAEMAEIVAGKDPMEANERIERVALTDTEAAFLHGLAVAKLHAEGHVRNIEAEILDFQNREVARRMGIHASLFVQFNPVEKWIAVRRDAPKPSSPVVS